MVEYGLPMPGRVKEATEAYRDEMDLLGPFFDECCESGDAFEESTSALYAAYRRWSELGGQKPLTKRAFGSW